MRHEADGVEDFVVVLGGDVLREGVVDLLNLGRVPVRAEGGRREGCLGEEDDAAGGAAEAVDGMSGGRSLLDEAEESVLEEAAAGDRGQAGGLVDG